MNLRSLLKLSTFLAASTVVLAQQTVTVTVTKDPSQTSVLATSATSTLATIALGTPHSPSATTSQATVIQDAVTAASSSSANDNDNNSNNGQYVDTDAGASGSSAGNSFNLSEGGLIAIIIIVVIVVICGIASTVLYVLAKRRQWNIRASISRASRRLTGRFGGNKDDGLSQRRDRRTGVYAVGARKVSPPRVVAIKPPGHKRGLVVDVQDVEKGPLVNSRTADSGATKTTWMSKMVAKK